MEQQLRTIGTRRRNVRLLALLPLAAMIALTIAFPARAQETPEATPEETGTRVRLNLPEEVVTVGQEFVVEVLIEDVEHLAGFDFTIEYDPSLVEPVEEADVTPIPGDGAAGRIQLRGEVGEFLAASERGENLLCNTPFALEGGTGNAVLASCATLGPPPCAGGLAGASGSGLLGRVFFKAKAAGTTTLLLTDPTNLILDDPQPCDGLAVEIPHSSEGAVVQLVGGDDGFPWLIVGIIAVVAVVLIGGLAVLRNQRRGAGTPS